MNAIKCGYEIDAVICSHWLITRIGERRAIAMPDALIDAFELRLPALDRLATIVRGADTSRLDLAPQSAGLYAVSLGLSQVFKDDHQMLRHGMVVYDALYAWCRDAQHETHAWPPVMP